MILLLRASNTSNDRTSPIPEHLHVAKQHRCCKFQIVHQHDSVVGAEPYDMLTQSMTSRRHQRCGIPARNMTIGNGSNAC